MSGIYIHIPFCRQACSYCDFYFVTRHELREEFVDRLCQEIDSLAGTPYADEKVDTIYFGGGTPSLLTVSEVEKIFSHLERSLGLDIQKAAEVTMELNPDDLTPSWLSGIRSLGVNRASMGVQSFDPARLRFMNRAHDANQAIEAMGFLRQAGFQTFTVDLIYGNPGQTLPELEEDVNRLLEFEPPHISAYALTIEPRTVLGKKVERGNLIPADEDLVAEQFDYLSERLAQSGLYRYEVSNYSKPGFEALHNTRYWHHENYLGLGPSAHSFWWDDSGAGRWQREGDLRRYLSQPLKETLTEVMPLNEADLAEERLMLGLRTRQGVGIDELKTRYGYRLNTQQAGWLEQKDSEGVLRFDGTRIALTDTGLKIADYLVVELLRRG